MRGVVLREGATVDDQGAGPTPLQETRQSSAVHDATPALLSGHACCLWGGTGMTEHRGRVQGGGTGEE